MNKIEGISYLKVWLIYKSRPDAFWEDILKLNSVSLKATVWFLCFLKSILVFYIFFRIFCSNLSQNIWYKMSYSIPLWFVHPLFHVQIGRFLNFTVLNLHLIYFFLEKSCLRFIYFINLFNDLFSVSNFLSSVVPVQDSVV